MSTRSLRPTTRVRVALLAIAAAIATVSVTAAEVEKKSEESQAAIEKKLDEARRRLDSAAREVAELSMSMSEYSVPWQRTGFSPQRAMLGVNLGSRGHEASEGVPIVSVSPGGAAEGAGLKAGDVLVAIGDKQLKRTDELSAREVLLQALGEVHPGEKVQLRYRRDNKVATTTVTAQAPDRVFATVPTIALHNKFAAPAGPGFAAMAQVGALRAVGVFGSTELVPLTPKLGQYFGTEKGLLVVRAPGDSRLKLEDGDVIVDIDGRTPSNPAHAFRILGSYQAGEKLSLNVLRQKKKMSFDITIPDEPAAGRAGPFIYHQQLDRQWDGPEGPSENIIIEPGPGGPSLMIAPPRPPEPGVPERGLTMSDEAA